jgi:hypothetical protein
VTDQAPVTDRERAAFEATFSRRLHEPATIVLADRFMLSSDHPLAQEHECIAEIQRALGAGCDLKTDAEVAGMLGSEAGVVALDEVAASGRGALVTAALERLLWLSVNANDLGRFRPEFNWYAGPALELIRRLLRAECRFAPHLLAAVLLRVSASREVFVMEIMPSLVAALERTAATTPLDQEMRAALEVTAAWMTKAARDSFAFSGGLNRTVGGQRIGKLVERMTRLASGAPPTTPNAAGAGKPVDEDALSPAAGPRSARTLTAAWQRSLGAPPPCEPTAAPPSIQTPTGSKRLTLRSLSKHHDLAAALFGEARVDKLEIEELSFGELVVLETSPQPWSLASGFVTKHRATAARRGFELALSTRSVSEVKPKPAAVRAALSNVHDDAAYRRWLADGLAAHESELAASQSALDEVVAQLASKKPRTPGLRAPEGPVRIVALNASAAIMPALYGVGPFNECPDPSVHAAVLGRFAREHGARLRYVSHDVVALDVESPPEKPAAIAWTAIAHYVYCREYPSVLDAAQTVVTGSWSFWWD